MRTTWLCNLARGGRLIGPTLLMAGTAAAQGGKASRLGAPTNIAVSSNASALTVNWTTALGASSYIVNRRPAGSTTVTFLAQLPAPPYSGALPTAGTAFEYQVVSVDNNKQAASGWVAYTVPLAPVTAVLMPMPTTTGTITPIIPGPTWLAANGTGTWLYGYAQCTVSWAWMTGPDRFRVMRSAMNVPEKQIAEVVAVSPYVQQANQYVDNILPPDGSMPWYAYRVFGVFSDGRVTGPSPSAACKAPATP